MNRRFSDENLRIEFGIFHFKKKLIVRTYVYE